MSELITSGVTFQVDPQGFAQLQRSSGIADDMVRRGMLVRDAAKAQVRIGHVRAGLQDVGGGARPNLRDTIVLRNNVEHGSPVILVGSDLSPIALFVHEGTKAHVIVPKVAHLLVFFSQRAGKVIRAKRVNHPGTKPNRYLTDNLHLAGGNSR